MFHYILPCLLVHSVASAALSVEGLGLEVKTGRKAQTRLALGPLTKEDGLRKVTIKSNKVVPLRVDDDDSQMSVDGEMTLYLSDDDTRITTFRSGVKYQTVLARQTRVKGMDMTKQLDAWRTATGLWEQSEIMVVGDVLTKKVKSSTAKIPVTSGKLGKVEVQMTGVRLELISLGKRLAQGHLVVDLEFGEVPTYIEVRIQFDLGKSTFVLGGENKAASEVLAAYIAAQQK